MKQVFHLTYLILFLTSIFFCSSCKKKLEPIVYSGQLLLSKKYPFAVANRKIEVYQRGTAPAIGLNSGSTSSSAIGLTNANGYFQLGFTPGTSRFIIFNGTNSSPLVLQSAWTDTIFPGFLRNNFPGLIYDPSKPIYVGKIIDTAIIEVNLISDLNVTDTIGLQTNTVNGSYVKEYSGLSGNVGEFITIDTVYNMLLTQFDCYEKKFSNTLYAGRKRTTVFGYSAISSVGIPSPYLLSDIDEAKVKMLVYFGK